MSVKKTAGDAYVITTQFSEFGIEISVDICQALHDGEWLFMEIWDSITGNFHRTVTIKEADFEDKGRNSELLHGFAKNARWDILKSA